MNQIPYTYCFIRKDLPIHYQIIQAAHATQEITKTSENPDRTCHFILFETKDEKQLEKIKMKLDTKNIKSHIFFEPDINEHTSLCTEPIYGDDRRLFKNFKMYK